MKVTDVKAFVVDCFRTNWVFIKVYTDAGVDGVGEATLEYKEHALLGAVEHIREYLTGQNPLDIERHVHDIYRDAYWRGGPVLMSALSAVEIALWDILGKHLGVPVYQLLGGKCRDKARIYVNGWFSGAKTPDEFAQKARIAVQRGVTAMKWDPFGKNYMNISRRRSARRPGMRGKGAPGGGPRCGFAHRGSRPFRRAHRHPHRPGAGALSSHVL